MSIATNNNIRYLFARPFEPVFVPKETSRGTVAIDVPKDFYTSRYAPVANSLSDRVGVDVAKTVQAHEVQHPDLKFTERIPIKGAFSLFNPVHQEIAGELMKLLLDQPDAETFFNVSAYIRDRVNPYLFQYALSVAVQHRKDTKDVQLMPLVQQFPTSFISSQVFPRLREEATMVPEARRQPVVIELNYTASPKEEEQRLAYFREDVGVNMHHWHWHLIYPTTGPMEVVNKDRRGELFYYMHSQIIARYNNDRFCNNLGAVKPFNNFREAIKEGYFPKILQGDVGRPYPPRVDNSRLHDLHRFLEETVEVNDLERWSDRVCQAIDQGFVFEQGTGKVIPLDDVRGIDLLGNMIESTILSPNRRLYGNLHNQGHNLISLCHDPENRHLEEAGVMSRVETAMRDPIFYRWHCFVDNIFKKFKDTLRPYGTQQLVFNGVKVEGVDVKMTRGSVEPNKLLTFWQTTNVNLANGLDFGGSQAVVQFQHLQHAPYEYIIRVNNSTGQAKRGTCRIFLLPKYDERGETLNFRDQRLLAVEMDKFTINLNPGSNEIRRLSSQSSVTIPYERSLKQIAAQTTPTEGDTSNFNFCGCGWPEHLLLPKGTFQNGTKYSIFVMVSDYVIDRPGEDPNTGNQCNDSNSFCGLKDQKYPDARAMGYPFDRNTRFTENVDVDTMATFNTQVPNSAMKECTVTFVNQTVPREDMDKKV